VATLPVALPLQGSLAAPQAVNPIKLVVDSAWGEDWFVPSSVAKRPLRSTLASPLVSTSSGGGTYEAAFPTTANDLAWLEQVANNSDNSDLQSKKDVAILALDAVFTQYGQ
jgi:hypothetical protein